MIHHYPDKFPESISLHSINIKTSILWRPHLFLSNTSGAEPILIFSWLWLDTDTEPVIPGDKNIMIFKGYLIMSLVTESLRIGNSHETFCLTANKKPLWVKVILQVNVTFVGGGSCRTQMLHLVKLCLKYISSHSESFWGKNVWWKMGGSPMLNEILASF